MRIAIDGVALQQGIAAGIFNVFCGLTNAINKIDPAVGFSLVIDPRLGPIKRDFLEKLDYDPQIIEARLTPTHVEFPRHLLTYDPQVRALVDDKEYFLVRENNNFVYIGPSPNRSFRVLSRSDRPNATGYGVDSRALGISIERVTIFGSKQVRVIPFNDPLLTSGFFEAEENVRWTTGDAVIPIQLFPPQEEKVTVVISSPTHIPYRLGEGLYDKTLLEISASLERLDNAVEKVRLTKLLHSSGIRFYVSNHFLPMNIPGLKNVAILYDIIPLLFPNYFMPDALENFQFNVSAFRAADKIFSISKTSSTDLASEAGVDPNKIETMYIDISPDFYPRTGQEINDARNAHGVAHRPYIICVGTLEPRKNQAAAVRAFATLLRGFHVDLDLVLVGKPGWGYSEVFRTVDELGLRSRVHFLTSVSNQDLASLYSGALYSIYPSLYEGFGLPVIEAMACGCPVITSARSSLSEIAGEAALLIDPTDVGAIGRGMLRLCSDSELRMKLSQMGLEHRKLFSWDASAQIVLNYLRDH